MLQQQELTDQKKHYDLHKLEHTNQTLEAERDSIDEDNKFIKNLSDGLKKKHENKLDAIKKQEEFENKKKEAKKEKKT
tara:strand:+ start:388 stop:621 length:234 start_codon:yes stop_codon:yes gene_type:complete